LTMDSGAASANAASVPARGHGGFTGGRHPLDFFVRIPPPVVAARDTTLEVRPNGNKKQEHE